MATPSPTLPSRPYNLAEITFIRDEVKFQHTLVGTRISWFVSAQAFLVTPFAICIVNPPMLRTFLLAFLGIPCIGMALSLLIVEGVHQAIRRIEQQHVRIQAYQTDHLLGPLDPVGQRKSLRFAVCVPWVFFMFWVIVILCGIRVVFINYSQIR
jgi:hypothetical protein